MKFMTAVLTLTLIFIFSSYSSAQFDLGEKLKKKLEKEVEKATDEAIDETVEGIKKGGKKEEKEKDAETKESVKQKKTEKNSTSENNSTNRVKMTTSGQPSFEGKVIFDVQEDNEHQVLEYYSKDNRYLMEMPDKGGSILFDKNELKMFVLVHKDKMYMETPMMPLSTGSGEGSISKTGETKYILGHKCEKFLFKQLDTKGEAWMTDELGPFMFFMESQKEMPEWQSEVLDAGYFPLEVTEYNERDKTTSVFTVRQVTPMELDEDLFVIPSSYEKLDLTNMGGFDKLIGQ